jgi:hypothetical protein
MATGEATIPEVDVEGAAPAAPNLAMTEHGKVVMTNPDNEVVLVDPDEAQAALAQKFRPSTQTELQREMLGTSGKIAAGAVGAGQGLSFGYALPAVIGAAKAVGADSLAEDVAEGARISKAAAPSEYLGGEIAGSLAGMYLMPGGAAKGVAGDSLVARGLSRFAQSAPRAALESGLQAGGSTLTEDMLGSHDATAEKYLTSIGGGIVFGGILGGGLHAVGGAIADKARGFYSAAEGAANREAGTVYRTAGKAADAAEGEAESGAVAWLRKKATTGAEEQAFKATGAKLKDIQKLGATAEAQAERSGRIGRRLLDEGIVTAEASQETIAKRLQAKVSEYGEELGNLRRGLDKAVERPSTEAIANRVQAEVLAPLERIPGTQAEAGEVRRYMLDFIDKAGERPSFETLHEFRRALGDKLNPRLWQKVQGAAPPAAEEMGRVHRILEEEFESAGERAAKELGGSFLGEYKVAKAAYSDLKTASDIVTKEIARGNGNRAISLTDTIAAGAAFAGGSQHDSSTGTALGVVGLLGNKAMRSHGNQIAAVLLNKASRLQILQRAAETTDAAITSGVKGFLGGKVATTSDREQPKVSHAVITALREAVRDPQALTARIAETLGGRGLTEAAPNVAQSAATTAMRIAAYLRDKAPKDPAPTGVSFIREPPRPGSTTEQARFAQAVEVANDPMTVVHDMQKGRLSREKVEALRACYPQLYQQLRGEIASQAADMRPKLSQQQEIALSVLFEEPVSAMMQPKTIRSLNDLFAQGADPSQTAQAGQPTQPTQPGRGLQRRGTMASGFDTQEAPRGK